MDKKVKTTSKVLQNGKKISLCCGWVCAAALLVCACLLALGCYTIYQSGPRAFSRESIGEQFDRLGLPIIASALAAIIASVASFVVRPETDGERMKRGQRALSWEKAALERRYARLEGSFISPEGIEGVKATAGKETKLRRVVNAVNALACVLVGIVCLAYLLQGDSFGKENYNRDVIKAICLVIPATLICLSVTYACELIKRSSVAREDELLKSVLAHGGKPAPRLKGSSEKREDGTKRLLAVRLAIAAVAVALVILGIVNGGISDVLGKAIRICTECIGLG